jgi:hypothetical protein
MEQPHAEHQAEARHAEQPREEHAERQQPAHAAHETEKRTE